MGQGRESGRVVRICRYPLKSMEGEELEAAELGELGLRGDRAFALVDVATGKVVSAKNPRLWPGMFAFRARYTTESPGAARVEFPDGTAVQTDDPSAADRLSAALGRPVRVASSAALTERARSEGYWPDHDFLEARDVVFDWALPQGTFFDEGAVHLVTTATLARLGEISPSSRFDPRRFRPNFVVEVPGGDAGFVENDWIGKTLRVGGEVVLKVSGPCPRCVMTTLAQADLPHDPNVLRTAVRQNGGNVGVYAAVERPGRVRRGDVVSLD